MQVKELLSLLSKMDPEMEVVISDPVNEGYLKGVEEALVRDVIPWDGEEFNASMAEPVCCINPTYELVAAHLK